MDNGLSASDVALMSGHNGWGDGFGSNGLWLFAILALMSGGFGNGFGWGGNNAAAALGFENLATSNEVQRGFSDQSIQAQTRDILTAVNMQGQAGIAATNQAFHDQLSATQNLYNELARDIAGLAVGQANALANQNQCCCDTKQLIMSTAAATDAAIAQSRYDNAIGLAGLEQRLTAKMDANTIQNLRDQVDALRDQVNMSGVLRFPNQWSYGAGPFPPIFGNCCGNNGFSNI